MKTLDPDRAHAIIAYIRAHPAGVTLADIARDVPGAPDAATLRTALPQLALIGRLELNADTVRPAGATGRDEGPETNDQGPEQATRDQRPENPSSPQSETRNPQSARPPSLWHRLAKQLLPFAIGAIAVGAAGAFFLSRRPAPAPLSASQSAPGVASAPPAGVLVPSSSAPPAVGPSTPSPSAAPSAGAPASGVAFTPPPPPVHGAVEPPAPAPVQPGPVDPEMDIPATAPAAATHPRDATGVGTKAKPDVAVGLDRVPEPTTMGTSRSTPTPPSASSGTSPNAQPSTRNSDVAAKPPTSAIENPSAPPVPAFPRAQGAYVLLGNQWVPLPRNHGQITQTTVQKANAALDKAKQWEDKAAGRRVQPSRNTYGVLIFSGSDQPPVVPAMANDVAIAYVGPIPPPDPEIQRKYPEVMDQPPIELCPLEQGTGIARFASVCLIVPDELGFGPYNRVAATWEQPQTGVTVLRCTLKPGRYALSAGAQFFELQAK